MAFVESIDNLLVLKLSSRWSSQNKLKSVVKVSFATATILRTDEIVLTEQTAVPEHNDS
jgi:hypothetical protein